MFASLGPVAPVPPVAPEPATVEPGPVSSEQAMARANACATQTTANERFPSLKVMIDPFPMIRPKRAYTREHPESCLASSVERASQSASPAEVWLGPAA